ncbi:unnamed protein product [Lymnaea stagnalis]|uniref:Endothelin-converting enzyme 1 n=1 Tax=Lymnaea stagnalis TaxID=6523 RepID=A0AAV2IRU6_LYMST
MTLAEVQGNYSQSCCFCFQQFDFVRYVNEVFMLPEIGITDVTEYEVVINQSPLYFQRLMGLLEKTPKRTVANYLVWRLIVNFIGTLGDKYKGLMNSYKKTLYGTETDRARFRRCGAYTTSEMSLAVGRMFIKDNFDTDARNVSHIMIAGLQKSFNSLLDDLDWMDAETKKVAKDKNENIASKIGYPKEVMNDTYLEEFYTNLTFNKDEYFENVLKNERESFNQLMRDLRQPVDKEKWDTPPPTVNAYYSAVKNQILFPAGILQPPFFSKTYPMSLNFGGIGVVIGHEITHGFDDRGRQYDKNGNLAQWWPQTAVDNFKIKAQCIIDQYGNFTVSQINQKLNGINTQGENIADNGGLKQAYKAYRNWVSLQGKEESLLPGLNFTHDQLFFINFAQLWCNLMTDGEALNRIRTGVHSPGEFRVIGSAQNSPDFAKAFNCPSDSYMNPKNKCRVW